RIQTGEKVSLLIDKERRALTARNHSCTHLLHKALKMTLGNHVEQAGSYVDQERLRFDFTHFAALTKEEIKQIEKIVNKAISADLKVRVENMNIEEAKKTGAAALFGEKYGDVVRVVTMGDFSKELCGGTHVANTGSIMAFKIISETSVAAGVRRIEALTSKGLLDYYNHLEEELFAVANAAKATPEQLLEKVQHLVKENKAKAHEIDALKGQLAKDSLGNIEDQVVRIDDFSFLAANVENTDMNALRDLGDQLRNKIGDGMVVLASDNEGKVNLIAMATKKALTAGAHAGNLIKEVAKLVGGGGGGRPDMAQAGGKNPAGIEEALVKAQAVFKDQITEK
ncbi:MAG TPA: alanine--tRNA ligase, partial [Candidatus Dorea intestinavium]|nr:alanine--tRNA ligase [Candidatus Dorea intestinavium]